MAGPNPTAAELKHFDEEYELYLDTQRQFAAASALANQGEYHSTRFHTAAWTTRRNYSDQSSDLESPPVGNATKSAALRRYILIVKLD